MEQTLIIYAHPKTKGHNPLILKEVTARLKEAKEPYRLVDLYALDYDPLLSEKEHYTSGGRDISEQNKAFQEKIASAKRLILIFPLWWGGPPAILKGFFDRVLTNHFAYRYKPLPFPILGLRARPQGLLKGKKAAVFITVGSPRWIHTLYTRNSLQFSLRYNILGFCGIRTRSFTMGDCGIPPDHRKERRIKGLVGRGLRWLLP